MRKIYPQTVHGIGGENAKKSVFSRNHFAGVAHYPAEIKEKIASWGLTRVAGNIWEKAAEHEFWQVKGGKIMKLVGSEVDEGQSIPAADEETPMRSISAMLEDLSF